MNRRNKFLIIFQLEVDVLALDDKMSFHVFGFGIVYVNKLLNFLGRLILLELPSFSWGCHFLCLGFFLVKRGFLFGVVFERLFLLLRSLGLFLDVLGGLSEVIGGLLERRNLLQLIFNKIFVRVKDW
jgi:hypothetical protein